MKKSTIHHLTVLILALSALTAKAQLAWPTRLLDFKQPAATETKLEGAFTFENLGKYPVTILSAKTSCGCTTTQLNKKTYNPGEKGQIGITFAIGNRSGMQQKEVVVETDDKANRIVPLIVKVDLPEVVRMSSTQLVWFIGDKSDAKTIRIEVPPGAPVHLLSVSSTNYQLMPKLRTVEPGKLYEVEVTPTDTKIAAKATLVIHTNYPPESPKILYASGEVKQSLIAPSTSSGGTPPQASGQSAPNSGAPAHSANK